MKYLILFMCLFLSSCQAEEVKNYSWYMQHPRELQQASMDCQTHAGQGQDIAKCEMIMHAAMNMTAIVNKYQQDPEKFGQRVIRAQEKLAELKLLKDQSDKAQKAYADQLQEVRVYLAVIGLTSPE